MIDAELGHFSSTAHGSGSSSSDGAGASSAGAHGNYLAQLESLFPSKAGAKDPLSVPARFGRPPISEDEGFWITSGGAFGAPPPAKVEKGKKK